MDRQTAIRHLVEVADAYLGQFDGPGIADVRSGIARWRNGALRDVAPVRIEPVKHVDTALDWMKADGQAVLAEAIEVAMPFLAWAAYDPYPREEIGEKYATAHAATILIGKHGQIGADGFDLGLFVFAPDTLYRDHCHAAPELYAPLTGPHGWRFASGAPLDWQPAHRPVWNEPWAQHAFKSGETPFFCIYAWTRDIAIPARMIIEPDWAELER